MATSSTTRRTTGYGWATARRGLPATDRQRQAPSRARRRDAGRRDADRHRERLPVAMVTGALSAGAAELRQRLLGLPPDQRRQLIERMRSAPQIAAPSRPDRITATPGQASQWYLWNLDPTSDAYHVSFLYHLDGPPAPATPTTGTGKRPAGRQPQATHPGHQAPHTISHTPRRPHRVRAAIRGRGFHRHVHATPITIRDANTGGRWQAGPLGLRSQPASTPTD